MQPLLNVGLTVLRIAKLQSSVGKPFSVGSVHHQLGSVVLLPRAGLGFLTLIFIRLSMKTALSLGWCFRGRSVFLGQQVGRIMVLRSDDVLHYCSHYKHILEPSHPNLPFVLGSGTEDVFAFCRFDTKPIRILFKVP